MLDQIRSWAVIGRNCNTFFIVSVIPPAQPRLRIKRLMTPLRFGRFREAVMSTIISESFSGE